jgi:hypothetical protein
VLSTEKSALRFAYLGELELGTPGLLEHELVAGNFHQINGGCEWRLNFDSVLVTELVSATHVSDEHNAIARKFPNSGIRTGHAPLANNAAVSASRYREQQDRRSDYSKSTLRLRKPDLHEL